MLRQRFNRLVVSEEVKSDKPGRWWLCQCDCGNTKVASTSKLRGGEIKSCGCLLKERQSTWGDRIRKHGLTSTTEYIVWNNMKQRCYNTNLPIYPHYGGRGISVCERWLESFDNFLNDMGSRPGSEYSIGRIDNDGDYCPENCRWENLDQQKKNKRWTQYVTYKREEVKLIDLCEQMGVKRGIVYGRLKNGWSLEEALNTPLRDNTSSIIEIDGVSKPINEHLKDFGVKKGTYDYRIKKGWSPEKAIKTPNQRGVKIQ